MSQFPDAQFMLSAWESRQFPPDEGAEVAFVGRSNAGKSSAMNAITGRRDLARTSKTPGRTQLINFFALGPQRRSGIPDGGQRRGIPDDAAKPPAGDGGQRRGIPDGGRRLTDLPGYGYAKVPADMQRHWRELLSRYVARRVSLAGLVIVMDARRPLTDYDWQMLSWCRDQSLATHLLLTKADKLNRGEANITLKQVRTETDGIATAQLFSAVTKTGVDEARSWILTTLATATSRPPIAAS